MYAFTIKGNLRHVLQWLNISAAQYIIYLTREKNAQRIPYVYVREGNLGI